MKSKTARCVICGGALIGRQSRFCSRRCKNADTNARNQSYLAQKTRGTRRKLDLLGAGGARCSRCGYDRNLAALTWHHLDPCKKSFSLDMRSLSNRGEAEILSEASKCIVLCANCHAEEHFPQYDAAVVAATKSTGRTRGR